MKVVYLIAVNRKKEGAAYNRVVMLCNGLRELGIKSDIWPILPSPLRMKLASRVWLLLWLIRLFIRFLFLSSKDSVIVYGEDLLLRYYLKLPRRAKLYVERNEYSSYLIRDNINERVVTKIKNFEQLLGRVDGMIVCSNYLKAYYSQFCLAPICVIPLVVDTDNFRIVRTNPQKYIAYCGDFGGNKDGLHILLDAFERVAFDLPQFKLYLIGDTSEDQSMTLLKCRVKELNIIERVVFTGRVPHSEMPTLLGNASLLVLARPANKQAEGGIPSKLAEYLATGRPTLVTRVGEIDRYLQDNENVFFAEPDSVEDFAAKIGSILKNYQHSKLIGLQGAEAVKQFDYKIWSKELIQFIDKNV